MPTFGDLAGLLAYVASDPRLFISSSTVMTTAFLCAAAVLTLAARSWPPAARLRGASPDERWRRGVQYLGPPEGAAAGVA